MKAKVKNEDVFSINGRGIVIAGLIVEGYIDIGDILILGDRHVKIRGIESFRKAFNTLEAGNNVGLLLDINVTRDEAVKYRGQILNITSKSEIRQDKLIELGI